MSTDSGFDGSVKIVGTVRNKNECTSSVLAGVGTVDNFNDIDETACIASFYKVPVTLLVKVNLGSVDDLHAVNVHLAAALHLQRQRARLTIIVVDCRTAVALSNAVESC